VPSRGIGIIMINGEVANRDRWVRFMTTQIARDKDCRLMIGEAFPLKLEDTIVGQVHDTRVTVY